MATVDDMAQWLLHRAAVDGERLSMGKLQSLLYYVQAWSLACHGEPAFKEDVLAGPDGPYVAEVNERFADHPLLVENAQPEAEAGGPVLLGVVCDGQLPSGEDCEACLEADILCRDTDTKATRLGYILDHAATEGWTVSGRENPLTAITFCPDCTALQSTQSSGALASRISKEDT